MNVLDTLTKRLDGPVRERIRDRVAAMMRQIDYLEETENPDLKFIEAKGWTKTRLNALCALNSFYQTVIGPLASSARPTTRIGLGDKIPIKYGEQITFDAARSIQIQSVHAAFIELANSTGLPNRFLFANHADDLIYQLSQLLNDGLED
jgi:hypothetical protein